MSTANHPTTKQRKSLHSNSEKPAIAFAHIGCEKNRVDTEHMLGLLTKSGYRVTSNETDANVVVINTCSFIQEARNESIKTLVDLAEKGKELIIAGCLAQHFKEELLDALPEAKAVVGTGDYQHIVEVLKRVENGERVNLISENPSFVGNEDLPRLRTTDAAVAYLKIAEGCDYRCSFCIIPNLRGNQRSRPIESIVAEAHQLANQGVKELILISQITTNYGIDLYGRPYLAELLKALGKVAVPWIRIHYAYPTGLTPQVLSAYRNTPNVLPYLDIPLQHSHPEVLKGMNRPWQENINSELLTRIRNQLPDAVLRTTLIVGFPGETEEHFNHLASFVKEQCFDHVGIFKFSPEQGTPAAELPNQVPLEIAQARKDKLMSLQQPISAERNSKWIGRTVNVLIEKNHPETGEMIGRCERFAPEVDGQVLLQPNPNGRKSTSGNMVSAHITGADIYDLTGEIVESKGNINSTEIL